MHADALKRGRGVRIVRRAKGILEGGKTRLGVGEINVSRLARTRRTPPPKPLFAIVDVAANAVARPRMCAAPS